MERNAWFRKGWFSLAGALLVAAGCEELDDNVAKHTQEDAVVPLAEVAQILASVPLGSEQLAEVAEAVASSSGNGYDEEYTMQALFADPGSGVGDEPATRSDPERYAHPLRELLAEAVATHFSTRVGSADPESYLAALSSSDIQIYWPLCFYVIL